MKYCLVVEKLFLGGELLIQECSHGMGEDGYCICPKYGEQIAHQGNSPCQEGICQECGAKMLREGSYHHELLKRP